MTEIKSHYLQPQYIDLQGRHLIEASAGTGKTYNITRIYLRLLLERQLDVKNILVMTFTRAATEELRSRIAAQLRYVLDNWGQFEPNDEFFNFISQTWTKDDIIPVIDNALLHLDEASVFTIHGFCNRVLSQQAFSSGVAFNVQMEAETRDLEMEAVRDWYRQLAQDAEAYELITSKWAEPDKFYAAFNTLFSHSEPVNFHSKADVYNALRQLKQQVLEALVAEQTFLFAELVDSHAKADERAAEWQELIAWLKLTDDQDLDTPIPKAANSFVNGNRYSRKPQAIKERIGAALDPVKSLKTQPLQLESQLETAKAYQLVVQGLEFIRQQVAHSKQQRRLMNYDDLISHLARALKEDKQGVLAQQIRDQFPVALVDEFQDTDPQQYDILSRIYAPQSTTTDGQATALYMIGDPKQAIYSFRNGDVFTYLTAQNHCDAKWVMDTNWRSSTQMIQAYNRLFYGAPLPASVHDNNDLLEQGSDKVFGYDIYYSPVKSSPNAGDHDLVDSQSKAAEQNPGAAIQFAYFPYHEDYAHRKSKTLMNQDFCPVVAQWCSAEIHRLLTEQVTYQGKALQENDIAVLVRDKTEAAYIRDALNQAGYSSVYLSTHDNVLLSEEAQELELMLGAILELENERLFIRGLTTRFSDCDSLKLHQIQQQETLWEQYQSQFRELRTLWYRHGFMAMAITLLQQHFHTQADDHERVLTNMVHLFELLQQASQRFAQPEELLNWFREQRTAELAVAESELRLESDANLIQIITQHGAKGLEYPIVFIPFATRFKEPGKFANQALDFYKYHDPETRALKYFLGQDKAVIQTYTEEALAEYVRLFYVAVTRAKQRCYICAVPFYGAHQSPLGKTLQLTSEEELEPTLNTVSGQIFEDKSRQQVLPPVMSVMTVSQTEFQVQNKARSYTEQNVSAAEFTGRIERNWWLSSFSALTRNLRHGGLSLPDRDGEELYPDLLSPIPSNALRFTLAKGADAGNLLHDIFEHLDFSQPDWQQVIRRPLSRFTEPLDGREDELTQWLNECLHAPLLDSSHHANSMEALSLSRLSWGNTLREVEFYFPMRQLKLTALSRLLSQYRGYSTSEPLIQLPGYPVLQGMMHGFIDLVFDWQGKYYVADYKSSWLGNRLEDYHTDALKKNIQDNYYDLQYLLYSLALHRYLKNRLPDYDPEQHFGGVYYLYLRGMNPDTQDGVFYTQLDSRLLASLDALFSDTPLVQAPECENA